MNKAPGYLKSDKRIFQVAIDEQYWPMAYSNWYEMSNQDKLVNKQKTFSEIGQCLTSNKLLVAIFSPIVNGNHLVIVKQINGKKRSRIRYTATKPRSNGSTVQECDATTDQPVQ